MDASRRQLIAAAAAAGVVAALGGVGYALFADSGDRRAVCYCSLDQEFSADLFAAFQRDRQLPVAPLYDAESQKTVGLANRLLAERARPQCDVFWNNEILQTVRLARAGLFEPYESPAAADLPPACHDPQHRWHGFAARARCLLVHNPSIPVGQEPAYLSDFVQPTWNRRLAFAAPVAGTTASHFAVLRTLWGDDRFRQFVAGLKNNRLRVTSGNSGAAKAAAEGQVAAALTDTDDALVQIAKGMDCRIVFPGQAPDHPGCLVIPTTVALIAGAPHPAAARGLIDAILDRATEQMLADGPSGQMPMRTGLRPPKGLEDFDPGRILAVDWEAVAAQYEAGQAYLIEQFG